MGTHAGEFTAEAIVPFIGGLIESARTGGTLSSEPLYLSSDDPTKQSGILRYPGKIAIDGNRLAISDSGNNRVLIARIREDAALAVVEMTAGTGRAGFSNGVNGQLNSPQGIVFLGDTLYVADAENHAVRAFDLATRELRTIAGTGSQLRTRADTRAGAMSSPWDLTLAGNTLFVAMAGTHQIWSVDIATGESRVHSGTGGEDIRDGENQGALLAQPMGITRAGERLYFADSESSAIRWADTAQDGQVGTVVGTGLFDFGDVDGSGDDVRLQHAQGVAFRNDGKLLVADSYNDCIKVIDAESRTSRTWVRGLSEPSGIACTNTHAYVADTNAHRIAVIELNSGETADLRLE